MNDDVLYPNEAELRTAIERKLDDLEQDFLDFNRRYPESPIAWLVDERRGDTLQTNIWCEECEFWVSTRSFDSHWDEWHKVDDIFSRVNTEDGSVVFTVNVKYGLELPDIESLGDMQTHVDALVTKVAQEFDIGQVVDEVE